MSVFADEGDVALSFGHLAFCEGDAASDMLSKRQRAEVQRTEWLDSVDSMLLMSRSARAACAQQHSATPWRLAPGVKRKAPRTHMRAAEKAARKKNVPKDPARLERILALAAEARESTRAAAEEGELDEVPGDVEQRKQRRGSRPARTAQVERAKAAMDAARESGSNSALEALLAEDTELVPQEWQMRYKNEGRRYWDHFYQEKTINFFKDRHYIREEFSELMPASVRADPKRWLPKLTPPEGDDGSCSDGRGDGVGVAGDSQVRLATTLMAGLDKAPDAAALGDALRACDATVVLEVGCAVGNAAFPMLRANPRMLVLACDLSGVAIELLRSKPEYAARRAYAFTCNITDDAESAGAAMPDAAVSSAAGGGSSGASTGGAQLVSTFSMGPWWCRHAPLRVVVPPSTVDFVTMVFVLSAVDPAAFVTTLRNAYWALKPGGVVLFRDYARFDLAQLRFPSGRRLDSNCYVRGDGTLAYYFEEDQLVALFHEAGFEKLECENRLKDVVNHKKDLQMARLWIQGKFRKPLSA